MFNFGSLPFAPQLQAPNKVKDVIMLKNKINTSVKNKYKAKIDAEATAPLCCESGNGRWSWELRSAGAEGTKSSPWARLTAENKVWAGLLQLWKEAKNIQDNYCSGWSLGRPEETDTSLQRTHGPTSPGGMTEVYPCHCVRGVLVCQHETCSRLADPGSSDHKTVGEGWYGEDLPSPPPYLAPLHLLLTNSDRMNLQTKIPEHLNY